MKIAAFPKCYVNAISVERSMSVFDWITGRTRSSCWPASVTASAAMQVGWGPQPLLATLDPLVAKAVTVYGSFSHTWGTWERALTILSSGQADVSAVIGGVYELADWREAFSAMESGRNVKSVLRVS